MSEEQTIQSELLGKFPCLQDKVRLQRARRVFAEAPSAQIGKVFDFAVRDMGFSILCAITGLDLGGELGVIYHLARDSGVVLNLTTAVSRDCPRLQSVVSYFPAAEIYERELIDLLGFEVQGLGPGPRYPLPDDWPAGQYPLRKDWQAPAEASLPQESEEKDV
jgi:Ni,Fe-hydrogenase III component G